MINEGQEKGGEGAFRMREEEAFGETERGGLNGGVGGGDGIFKSFSG